MMLANEFNTHTTWRIAGAHNTSDTVVYAVEWAGRRDLMFGVIEGGAHLTRTATHANGTAVT